MIISPINADVEPWANGSLAVILDSQSTEVLWGNHPSRGRPAVVNPCTILVNSGRSYRLPTFIRVVLDFLLDPKVNRCL